MSNEFILNREYLENIKILLRTYKSSDNSTHKNLTMTLNRTCGQIEYPCYLLEIFNNKSNEVIIRQLAGICIKNFFERFSDSSMINFVFLNFFKNNGLSSLYDEHPTIRNTLGFIISSFLKIGGVKNWKELPLILTENLYSNDFTIFSKILETVNFIIEDSGEVLIINENGQKFVSDLIFKIKNTIYDCLHNKKYNEKIIVNILIIIINLIKRCNKNNFFIASYDGLYNDLCNLFNLYVNVNSIKEKIGRIWLKIFKKYDFDILINQFNYFNELFLNFLAIENQNGLDISYNNTAYDLNMCACDFFDLIVRQDDNYKKYITSNPDVNNTFSIHLSRLINILLHKISLKYNSKELINEMDQEQIIEIDDVVNVSVRKSSALILEHLAWIMPEFIFNNSKEVMEKGLNSINPLEKEKSLYLISMTGAYCFEKFPDFIQPLISYLFSFVNVNNESKIVILQTIHALSQLDSFIFQALLSRNVRFVDEFNGFFSNLFNFFQSDDEKYQILSSHFFLIFLNSPFKDNGLYTSSSNKTSETHNNIYEVLFPYANEILKILCYNLESNRKNRFKIKVKLKMIEIFENLLINYSDILPKCEYFQKFISFVQRQSLNLKKEDIENEDITIYILQLIPYILDKFFNYVLNMESVDNNYARRDPCNNNYILNILKHVVKFMQKNYDERLKGIDDSYNPDLFANVSDILTAIIKYSFKNNYLDNTIISLIDNESIYDLMLLYSQKSQSLIHKFSQFIGELARIPKISVIINHIDDIMIYFIEILKSIENPSDCFTNNEYNILIANVIYSLGNILVNYINNGTKYYSDSVLKLILRFFEDNTTEEIGESIIYTYGKIALVYPQMASNSFKKYLQSYLKCFLILNVSNSEEKIMSLEGIVKAMLLEKFEYISLFDELSLVFISYDNLPDYFVNVYKMLYYEYSQHNPYKLRKIIESLDDNVKFQIEDKLLNVKGRSF